MRNLISKEKQTEICKKAINTFGERRQVIKVCEELGELQTALCKFTLDNKHNVEEEMADVEIMLSQLRLMTHLFDISEIERIKEKKLKRLEGVVW